MYKYYQYVILICLLAFDMAYASFDVMDASTSKGANPEPLKIAVAANFSSTLRVLADRFKKKSGVDSILIQGSSGKLSTQIKNGAPFDVFLSADQQRIIDLSEEGFVDSSFNYAQGQLVLISSKGQSFEQFSHTLNYSLAMANPVLAPYGLAANETLQYYQSKIDKRSGSQVPQVLTGQSALQAYQFVLSGNADFGLVPLSFALKDKQAYWIIPSHIYTPLMQRAAIIHTTKKRGAAIAFLKFIQQPESRKIIQEHGYLVEF